MRKFTTFLGLLILAIVVIALVLPLGMGFWLKNHYQQILTHLDRSRNVTITLVKFDRGWFSSRATVTVTIFGSWLKSETDALTDKRTRPSQFTIQERIIHGPFAFGKTSTERFRLFFAKALVYSDSNNPNFTFQSNTLIRFGNVIKNTFSAKKISITSNQQQFVINDTKSNLLYNTAQHQFTSETTIASATLFEKQNGDIAPNEAETKFTLQNISMNAHLKQKAPLWYGDRSMKIEKLTYFDEKNNPTNVDNILLQTNQSESNETTTVTFSGHVDTLDNEWLKLKPIDLSISLSNINTKALIALMNNALQLQQQSLTGPDQLKSLSAPAVQLLSHGLMFQNHFNAGTENGPIAMNAKIHFPPQTDLDNLPMLLANAQGQYSLIMPLDWLKSQLANLYQNKKLTVNNQALTPTEVAEQQVHYWITNKKLIPDGQNVKLDITYDKGQFLINGLPPSYGAPQTQPPQPNTIPPAPPPSTDQKS